MQIVIKLALSLAVILLVMMIGKKFPAAAGLIAVMPLTGALALAWTYMDNEGRPEVMQRFTSGAVWGLLPSMLFFLVAFVCFRKNLSLPVVLPVSFAMWLLGAFVHQWLLK
jgi:uncharacterized membrane protein (GlpM family)